MSTDGRYSELAVKLHNATLNWHAMAPDSRGQSLPEYLAKIASQHFEPELTVAQAELVECNRVLSLKNELVIEREREVLAFRRRLEEMDRSAVEARAFARKCDALREAAERECDELRKQVRT